MSKSISQWLYGVTLRDFINIDVKVIITSTHFLFVSKVEDYTFREIPYGIPKQPKRLSDLEVFMVWDEIFTDIINLRDTDEKI